MRDTTFMYELRVHDDGDIEVRKIPDSHVTDNLSFDSIEVLQQEIRGYGSRDDHEVGAMKTELESAGTYEWITV